MKNRPLNPPCRVPREIKEEYNILLWYQRALEDLEGMNSIRALSLMKEIRNAMEYVAPEPVGFSGTIPQIPPPSPEVMPGGETAFEPLSEPWYNEFVVPSFVSEWILNIRVKDLLFLVGVCSLFWVYIWWCRS